jgi:acrylyl-CoA reductase (NADPH)
VSLLGINSTDSPSPELERQVWGRLAGDLRPTLLAEMARTVAFHDLPGVFDDFMNARVSRRVVVKIGG